jgi:hypothetical protein
MKEYNIFQIVMLTHKYKEKEDLKYWVDVN